MRVKAAAAFLCLCVLFFVSPAYSIAPVVTSIDNRAYGNAVLQAIDNAKDSVYVAMYAMYVRYDEPDNPAYKLVEALIAAHGLGVKVTVYLDKSTIAGFSKSSWRR